MQFGVDIVGVVGDVFQVGWGYYLCIGQCVVGLGDVGWLGIVFLQQLQQLDVVVLVDFVVQVVQVGGFE